RPARVSADQPTPRRSSVAVNQAVTFPMNQPLSPGSPSRWDTVTGGAPSTGTGRVVSFKNPAESFTSRAAMKFPAMPYACCAVGVEDHAVSQTPSFVQFHRNCSVALGFASQEADPLKVTGPFSAGQVGA